MRNPRALLNCLLLLLLVILPDSNVLAGTTMTRIRDSGEIRVGLRTDAFPFAYIDPQTNTHAGFSVDMAHLLTAYLSKRFERVIHLRPISVTAGNRIQLIHSNTIDVEMGVSSLNQVREEMVDFSLIYFISETTFIFAKNSGIAALSDLNGKRLGAARGTTNLDELNKLVAHQRFKPQAIRLTDTHAQGMQALQQGRIDAYCSDRILLDVMRRQTRRPSDWVVLDAAVAYEPYAFMLPEGQSDFRDFLNDTIRWAVTSGRFDQIYDHWMGPNSANPFKMPPALKEYLRVVVYPMTPSWWQEK